MLTIDETDGFNSKTFAEVRDIFDKLEILGLTHYLRNAARKGGSLTAFLGGRTEIVRNS